MNSLDILAVLAAGALAVTLWSFWTDVRRWRRRAAMANDRADYWKARAVTIADERDDALHELGMLRDVSGLDIRSTQSRHPAGRKLKVAE